MSIALHAIAERAIANGPSTPAKGGSSPKRRIVAQGDATLTPEPR